MVDLHRHDEFSLFDGFGKAKDNAAYAKEIGHTSLSLANHGNLNGLVQHYLACKDEEIKPILGVEAYFQPLLNNDKKRYHLCLFAKDLEGYHNLNRIQTIAENQMYYKPITTFKELKKYGKGLICTSACIAGPISQALVNGNKSAALKLAKEFKNIFGDDFYIEIQPYKLGQIGLQENINLSLIKLSQKLDIKCILTSDSHYANSEDWPTYLKMHEMAKSGYDIKATYGERFMPTEMELKKRFYKMHKDDFGSDTKAMANEMISNLEEIEEKIEDDILVQLPMILPEFVEGHDSYDVLERKVKEGLKDRGKYNKQYIQRCKEELEVIKGHGFSDYFLIVADYTQWAKDNGIAVGPGRGSVCNCQVAWALHITDVDSIRFDLDFRRFLRHDKKKIPDIDLDFETARRQEVIDYIANKYKGHAAQIRSYGLFKVDNTINDLAKVCGLDNKQDMATIKKTINKYIDDNILDEEGLKRNSIFDMYNKMYDDIMTHFLKLYKKVKYLGTHAAGVAVTGGDIEKHTTLKEDKKTGKIYTAYNLSDLDKVNLVKFDILGLSTMEQIGILRRETGKYISEDWFEDENILKAFGEGNTDGIFQFEKPTAKQILRDIKTDCIEDIIAASSMNRPGPLSLGQPAIYASNKENQEQIKNSKYYKYTKDSYGTIIYQEQIQQICINIGGLSWEDADSIMKMLKGGNMADYAFKLIEKQKKDLKKRFTEGALKNGLKKEEAHDLFEKMLVYSFNKGHATGYTIISIEEMFYKIYYPTEFWYVKCRFASDDGKRFKYRANAVKDGVMVFLPHVNYTADYSLRKFDREKIIQEGLISIKNVGEKAAQEIEKERIKNGNYKSIDDFMDRVPGRVVNRRVVNALLESGALEFDKNIYLKRVVKYNSSLYMRG